MNNAIGTPVFEYTIQVSADQIDELQHVNNVAYVQLMQDAANKHWHHKVAHAIDHKVFWVVKRHEIDYHSPALLHDQLLIRTWTGDYSAVTWNRHYEIIRIADQKKIISAKSIWVLLDRSTGKPKRIDQEILDVFR